MWFIIHRVRNPGGSDPRRARRYTRPNLCDYEFEIEASHTRAGSEPEAEIVF